jgi:hypothetical protein
MMVLPALDRYRGERYEKRMLMTLLVFGVLTGILSAADPGPIGIMFPISPLPVRISNMEVIHADYNSDATPIPRRLGLGPGRLQQTAMHARE